EAIRVAEALGRELYAVRLDTPSSRRGDFFKILEEVRWELDLRGFDYVKILASGGIDEYEILKLNSLVDGYGVGTSIANAPVLSFALDIMEIEGVPMAKRGKRSGAKQVWRFPGTVQNTVLPAGAPAPVGPDRPGAEALLQPPVAGGPLRRGRGGAAKAADRGRPARARPAAPAHPARVRDGADGTHRHHGGAESRAARRLLAEWASWMRSSPTSAPRWPSSRPGGRWRRWWEPAAASRAPATSRRPSGPGPARAFA